jgi:hypothetical protein
MVSSTARQVSSLRRYIVVPGNAGGAKGPDFWRASEDGEVEVIIDGTKVTMYARWRNMEDYQSMRQDPGPLPFLQEALTFATFEPGMYEIVRTFKPVDN